MFTNIQNKETDEEMKEIPQQNFEKKTNDTTSQLVVKEMNICDKLDVLQKQIVILFEFVDDLSSSLTRLERQIELKSFLNAKYRRQKEGIVSLTPSDLEESEEDIGQTDSTRSEDSEPNSDDRNAIVKDMDIFMESDESYCPSTEELDEDEFTEESSVEMLSRNIIDIDLEKNEK